MTAPQGDKGQTNGSERLHEANKLFKAGKYQEALDLLDRCGDSEKKVSAYYNIKGVCLSALNEHALAAPMFLEAIKIDPLNPLPYTNIGNCLANNLQFEEADKYYDLALTLDENYFEALVGKGVAAFQDMNYDLAEQSFSRALEIRPDNVVVLTNLGNCYSVQGRYDEALTLLNKVLNVDPLNGLARTNRGLINLGKRDFTDAWTDYEFRFDSGNFMPKRFHDIERWTGPSTRPQNVLIWAEQGLGDEIMFSTLFHELEGLVETFFIECDPRLYKIFCASFPGLNFIPKKMIRNTSAINSQIPVASLGAIFRKSLNQFPPSPRHLSLPTPSSFPNESKEFLANLRSQGKRLIGVSWESFALTKNFRGRKSISADAFSQITEDNSFIFVNLQFANPHKHEKNKVSDLPRGVINVPGIDLKNNVEHIAELILELDLIVTIGNSVAHIACAFGAKPIILLPAVPDWRWGHHEDETLWYRTGKIKRNHSNTDWSECLNDVRTVLIARRT